MYRRREVPHPDLGLISLPFLGTLDPGNRWMILANEIPWTVIEDEYAKTMDADVGAGAINARIAFGAMIIKEKLHLTDEETVQQIKENPYLQCFLGYHTFITKDPSNPSMMVHFRLRFPMETVSMINNLIVERRLGKKGSTEGGSSDPQGPGSVVDKPNEGQMICDATCAPQDIHFPTDVELLNDAREKAEQIIDVLHEHREDRSATKARTYRKKARKDYLNLVRKKRKTRREIRRAIRKQIQYLRRDLGHIQDLAKDGALRALSKRQYRNLLVASEILRQQTEMYKKRADRIDGRIVSLSQPHVRPIVRGKAGKPVEFGAKISLSVVDGMCFLDRLSWDAYNESQDLQGQIEAYRRRFGVYPESVHADKIYRTRGNLSFCSEHGIRLSGPKLGRPFKIRDEMIKVIREQRRIEHADERKRVEVEGKIGECKRRYNLGQIYEKLKPTSETAIAMGILMTTLERILRDSFPYLFIFSTIFNPLRLFFLSFGRNQRLAY
jgi:IS5 family transposase